ncbi:MAG: TauD/TfdA family dioxygenase [Sphingomonas sp.]
MTLSVNPLHPIFAAEIVGADLSQPPTPELVATVEKAMEDHAVTVVRGADVSDADHIRFSRAFGPLELPPGLNRAIGNAPQENAAWRPSCSTPQPRREWRDHPVQFGEA